MSVFIIAEAGVNHNNDANIAIEMVETAKRCGADAVKFQTFMAEKLITPGTEMADYQRKQVGPGDQYTLLKELELSAELHQQLFDHCSALNIEFMSTPFDEQSADFLIKLGMTKIKISSGEITNEPFLAFLAEKGLPILLSTGMATMPEVHRAVQVIKEARNRTGHKEPLSERLTLLHCTSNYPARCEDVHLRAMQIMASETNLSVGYSDHTRGVVVSTAAVALGATVIEKHFTLDKNLKGPDHQASLLPEELFQLVHHIRMVESALGLPIKQPCADEFSVRALVRRSVVLIKPVQAAQKIEREDITLLRPGTGISPAEFKAVIGKRAMRDLPVNTVLQWSDLS